MLIQVARLLAGRNNFLVYMHVSRRRASTAAKKRGEKKVLCSVYREKHVYCCFSSCSLIVW